MNNEPIVEFKDVSKMYGDILALENVSLELRRGEKLALLGPNGAGKTTTIGLLLGMLKPSSGEIRVFGVKPGEPRARMRTGAMLQVSGLPPSLSVNEQLRLFSSYYPSHLEVDEISLSAGLGGLEHRRYGKLSTGQQQKVHYGISICGDPDLLVLDEPTVSLDVESRRMIWNDLKSRLNSARACVLATHNLEEAEILADRIVLLSKGRVIADSSPNEIKAQVAGRTIVVKTALNDVQLNELNGVLGWRRTGEHVHLYVEQAAEALRGLLNMDDGIEDIDIHSADLEDAFLNLLIAKRTRE